MGFLGFGIFGFLVFGIFGFWDFGILGFLGFFLGFLEVIFPGGFRGFREVLRFLGVMVGFQFFKGFLRFFFSNFS